MQLILAIAALCTVHTGSTSVSYIMDLQTRCQQSYLHCINVKKITLPIEDALEKCVMEKK